MPLPPAGLLLGIEKSSPEKGEGSSHKGEMRGIADSKEDAMRSKALALTLVLVGGLLAGPAVVMGVMGPGSGICSPSEQYR